MAFEHHDSNRTHLFEEAAFAGSKHRANTVETTTSPSRYLTPYNVVYLDQDSMFVYGGGFGDKGGKGAFVAKVDPTTLETLWSNQLINTRQTHEWDYPGVLSANDDGFLYQIYGYRLAKIDPATGVAVETLTLPTPAQPRNTSYNGFVGLEDGTLVAKAVYRQRGCERQGFSAFLDCPHPGAVPPSMIVAIDTGEMKVLDQIKARQFSAGRITSTRYDGQDLVYLIGRTKVYRYIYADQHLRLDRSWGPVTYLDTSSGQTPASAVVVLDDWVVFADNGTPVSSADSPSDPWMTLHAINQGDATQHFTTQPFKKFTSPSGYPISFSPSAVSVDPSRNLVYGLDAGPGRIGAFHLGSNGFRTVWTRPQRTTEFLTLIGSRARRVLVGTHIPSGEPLGSNKLNRVIYRDAVTGRLLARSRLLRAVLNGTMVQPGYSGRMYYLADKDIIRLTATRR